jgi:uncharacterized protein YbjT (DUF2867 family)
MPTILVTGATGNAGGAVVRSLLDIRANVRALVRSGSESKLPAGAEPATGDLNDPESLRQPLAGVNAVFLLSGYRGIEQTLREMRTVGVERVVLLSSSAAPTDDLSNAIARYHILSERAVGDSGLPWTFLQPNSLMSNAFRWLPQLEKGETIRGPFADVPIATIDPDDLGAVAAAALTSEAHEGRTYRLSGPEALRPADQVAILADVAGRDLQFEAQSDDEARAEMEGAMPKDYVDAFFDFFADGAIDETTVLPTVSEILGRQPGTFRQWALRHASAFQ